MVPQPMTPTVPVRDAFDTDRIVAGPVRAAGYGRGSRGTLRSPGTSGARRDGMLRVGEGYQSYQGSNGAPGWAKPAAGAAAGGTVILLAARRRRKKKREAEARTV